MVCWQIDAKTDYREVLKPDEISEEAFSMLSVADRLEFLNGELFRGKNVEEIMEELGITAKALGHYDCVFIAGEFREVPKTQYYLAADTFSHPVKVA
jgi:hypothetical protein